MLRKSLWLIVQCSGFTIKAEAYQRRIGRSLYRDHFVQLKTERQLGFAFAQPNLRTHVWHASFRSDISGCHRSLSVGR